MKRVNAVILGAVIPVTDWALRYSASGPEFLVLLASDERLNHGLIRSRIRLATYLRLKRSGQDRQMRGLSYCCGWLVNTNILAAVCHRHDRLVQWLCACLVGKFGKSQSRHWNERWHYAGGCKALLFRRRITLTSSSTMSGKVEIANMMRQSLSGISDVLSKLASVALW